MYNFYYHIPSAMIDGKWNMVQNANNNEKWAASRAVVVHFRGSEYPQEVEVWIRRNARGKAKIKKFMCREKGTWMYDAQRITEAEAAET